MTANLFFPSPHYLVLQCSPTLSIQGNKQYMLMTRLDPRWWWRVQKVISSRDECCLFSPCRKHCALSLILLISLVQSYCPQSPGFLHQWLSIISLQECNWQSSTEGNRCSSMDNWHYGQHFSLDNTQPTYFGCCATVDDWDNCGDLHFCVAVL